MVKNIPNLSKNLLVFSFLFLTFYTFGQITPCTSSPCTVTGPGNYSFQIPDRVTQITVEVWGAGGSGSTKNGNGGSGGGGGGAYSKSVLTVVPGVTYNYIVGEGAQTPLGTDAPLIDGGDTSFNLCSNPIVLAKGGISAPTAVSQVAPGSGGAASPANLANIVSRKGGDGAQGQSSAPLGDYGGGGGSSAGPGLFGLGVAGNNGSQSSGGLAVIGGGGGGNGAALITPTNSPGIGGDNPGGGGGGIKRGGAPDNKIGGKGGDGQIRITWVEDNSIPIALTNGPGGITSDLALWLRSDLLDGTTAVADNTNVTSWATHARGSNAVTKAGATQFPKYKNNATENINFNAVVDFDNPSAAIQTYANTNQTQYLSGDSGFYTQDIFVVLVPKTPVTSASAGQDIFSGDQFQCVDELDKTGIGFGDYTARFSGEVLSYGLGTASMYGTTQISGAVTYNSVGIINARNNTLAGPTEMQLHYNGVDVSTTTFALPTFANVTNSKFWIGRSEGYNGSLNARVAEVITYSSRKNDASERNKIESYLAIKYGITLGVNGTSQNYVDSNNIAIWNTADNSGYNFDIAGIGRDDISKLNQKQSKSVNSANSIAIGLGSLANTNTANTSTFVTDRDFLVWGSNGLGYTTAGSTSTKNLNNTTTSFTTILRKWKIKESQGDVGEVIVSIPETVLTTGIPKSATEEYVIVVSSTTGFEEANIIDVVPLKIVGTNLQTWYDFDGTKFFTFAKAPLQDSKLQLNIQTGDFLVGERDINLNSTFTISSWIRNGATAAVRTFIAKGTAYDLKLNATHNVEVSWNNAIQIASTTTLADGKWHQVAVTYSGTTATLYIDGVVDKTVSSLPSPSSTTARLSIGGAYSNKASITAPFLGDIDEVRIWDVALTPTQLRYIMNQEMLKFTDNTVNGREIPQNISKNDIKIIPWSNVKAYYDLNSYYGTVADDKSNSRNYMRIKYLNPNKQIVNTQTSPIPYESVTDGLWSNILNWSAGSVQTLPNSLSIVNSSAINWNIVKINHTIDSNGNKTVLGLLVNNTGVLNANNDSKLEISHYLKLNGKIDLVGRSQLLQTEESDLDQSSSGFLERDQQGQANKYNYNYWSSPVSTVNITANNTNYTVGGVLYDGTNVADPKPITWWGGFDGMPTTPSIKLARYWIYKFDNYANAYASWARIGETGSLRVGQGFTLKGSGALTNTQNYTFIGKPNNGTITTNSVSPGQLLLTGNPYPSALDVNAFITDNSDSIDGTLYFWEHYTTNNTHILREYQGGYALRNFTGGVPPSSVGVDFISGSGSTTRSAPNQYIPVGQGFFVTGKTGGVGTITFKNSQRGFQKENETTSNIMYKIKSNKDNYWNSNESDKIEKENYKRVRLGFNSHNNVHRQVLLGFMDENATSEMDYGYDGLNFDNYPNDMYFVQGQNQLVIQGVGFFDKNASYAIGVKADSEGKVKFMIDGLENFDDLQAIYIYDKESKTYHNIRKEPFEVDIPKGENNSRFALRFHNETISIKDANLENGIQAFYSREDKILNINNTFYDAEISTVYLYNASGKLISDWKIQSGDQTKIKIPIKNANKGIYIVKLVTTKGTRSKKIIVN